MPTRTEQVPCPGGPDDMELLVYSRSVTEAKRAEASSWRGSLERGALDWALHRVEKGVGGIFGDGSGAMVDPEQLADAPADVAPVAHTPSFSLSANGKPGAEESSEATSSVTLKEDAPKRGSKRPHDESDDETTWASSEPKRKR